MAVHIEECEIMEKSAAIKLNEMLVECYFKLHESIDIAREHCDEAERKAYCGAVGKVLGYLLLDVLEPIYSEHPDLRPELLKST
jgi:hypothetical protein